MNVDSRDADRGVYNKFRVERTDGRSASGEKHHGCRYFVLDLDHDPYSAFALTAYADACERTFPALASDLRAIVQHGNADAVMWSDPPAHKQEREP